MPHEHSFARDDPSAPRHYQAPLYCFPQGSLYASGFAGVAMGIARSLLEDFVALATDKTPRGYSRALRESAVTQSQVAQAEAKLGAARVYVLATLREIWSTVGRTGVLELEQRVAIRLAASHAIRQAREVADFAYHAAGGHRRSSRPTPSSAASATSTRSPSSCRGATITSRASASFSSACRPTPRSSEPAHAGGTLLAQALQVRDEIDEFRERELVAVVGHDRASVGSGVTGPSTITAFGFRIASAR